MWEPLRTSPSTSAAGAAIATVTAILEGYAAKAVCRGFSATGVRGGKAHFRLLWHRGQYFDLTFDPLAQSIRMPLVLPQVPVEMYREYQVFVEGCFAPDRPEHRRIEASRCAVQLVRRSGTVGLTLRSFDGDLDYAVRKLIHLVHETYLDFLYDGRYYSYLIETFNLDPDEAR